ncbi:MAG TPA: DHH family phosphoesterase, partial [Virgibacillus sp.]|nr:DHH family phosphoesterase [Virgibacillus sp.]
VGEEALLEMPIGIILFDDDYKIEWSNPYMNQFGEADSLVGEPLNILSEEITSLINQEENDAWIELAGYVFQVEIKREERLLYLFDRTSESHIKMLYDEEQAIIAIIYLDNYEEITRNMDDTLKSQLNSEVTSVLNNWSRQYGLYLKRTSQDRFIAVGTHKLLDELEKSKFSILDDVRKIDGEHEQKNPVTLSIGVGLGTVPLPTLGELAQSSLDLALGRGGDQVVIKDESGKVRFYGGKTNPMEKRTRVRARVISHALKELVKQSDKVIIMGHKSPDMDSLGASIGILNIAQANDVEGYVVFDPDDLNPGMYRIIDAIKEEPSIWKYFVSPDDAEEIITNRSLIVIVDTHKPTMLPNERLLNKTSYKVVIDHHRRGEDFIEHPTLVYMEPYASSTSELVTELLEYQPKSLSLKVIEATALLAGIIVDTKSFTLRTGSRTFDAASYLRSRGADTVLVQRFMKEDINNYIKRSKLIERANIYRDSVAISTAKEGEVYDHVLIAQAADTLLSMKGITASFVISEREDGQIGISARSLGDINVQIIMEKMSGGGHLTNAAAQIADTTITDAEAFLKDILDEYFEGRDE